MKKGIAIPCSASSRLFVFGFFAVISQLAFIWLYITELHPYASPAFLFFAYSSFFEYPLAAFALVLGGAWLFDRILME